MWHRGTKSACEICKNPASFMCYGCKTTHYCSQKHQALDWEQHKTTCQLYAKVYIKQKTLTYPNRRRTLVAQSHFKKGSSIYIESPILESPDDALKTPKEMLEFGMTTSCIVCHTLLIQVENTISKNACSNCSWPLCDNESCSSFHADMECGTLARNKLVGPEQFSKTMPPHRFVYYLRILKLDDKNSNNYVKIMDMDIHPEIDQYAVTTADIITPGKALPFIAAEQSIRYKEFLRISELYNCYHASEEERTEIIRLIQVADWNSRIMNVSSAMKSNITQTYYGLYYVAPSAPQTCMPNAMCVSTSDYKLNCFATQDIDVGEVITISQDHVAAYLDNLGRGRRLREKILTKCLCPRCQDPTEMGSHNGSFFCGDYEDQTPGCKTGYLMPFSIEKKSKSLKQIVNMWAWKCDQCGIVRSMKAVGSVRARILKKFELFSSKRNNLWISKLSSPELPDGSIDTLIGTDAFIHFMEEQQDILHPNNFILTRIKVKLMEWYSEAIHKIFILGKQGEFQAQILDAAQKLLEMSGNVVELLNIFLPGLTEMRSYIDYYRQQGFILMAPKLIRTMVRTEEEKEEFRKMFKEITRIRRDIRTFCKHTLNWNCSESIVDKLEWVDIDGQLYKLLRRTFPSIYAPKGTKIRITTINKKIVRSRRDKKVKQFMDSLIVDGHLEQDEESIEEVSHNLNEQEVLFALEDVNEEEELLDI